MALKQKFATKTTTIPKPVAQSGTDAVARISPFTQATYSPGLAPSAPNAPKLGAKHYLRVLPAVGDSENWYVAYRSVRVFNDANWNGELALPWDGINEADLILKYAAKEIKEKLGVTKIAKKSGKEYLALPDDCMFLNAKPRVAVQVVPVKVTVNKGAGAEALKLEDQNTKIVTLALTPYQGATTQSGSVLLGLEDEKDDEGNPKFGEITPIDAGFLVSIESVPKGTFYDYNVTAVRPFPLLDAKGEVLKIKELPNLEDILNKSFELDMAIKYATGDDAINLLKAKLSGDQLHVVKNSTYLAQWKSKFEVLPASKTEETEVEDGEPSGDEPF